MTDRAHCFEQQNLMRAAFNNKVRLNLKYSFNKVDESWLVAWLTELH